jgi:two-component system sensor histidine kinase BarA
LGQTPRLNQSANPDHAESINKNQSSYYLSMLLSKRSQTIAVIAMILITIGSVIVFKNSNEQLQLALFIGLCILLLLIVFIKFQPLQIDPESAAEHINSNASPDVLVVDDTPSNRHFIVKALETFSLSAIEADNGQKALNLMDQYSVRIIFMDINMEAMDGIETTKKIRANEDIQTRVPIVAISAFTDTQTKQKALLAGFDDYLPKPVDETKLKTVIERWLQEKTKNNHGDVTKNESLSTQALDKTHTSLQQDKDAHRPDEASLEQQPEKTKKVVDIKQSLVYSHNNTDLAKEMLSLLITSIANDKDKMVSLYKNKDWEKLGDLVHKLNGGSCYCGVPDLQQYAQSIDKAIQQKNYNIVEDEFSLLEQAMNDLLEWEKEHDMDIIFDP